jgi:DNA invertase Pin-like site-specific DNA recombinase
MDKQNNSKIRAAGYSRTSGEGQRDNTSIPRQKSEIERYAANNGWKFIRHYVDESLSGAKIEGRDDYKRMMKDAANGQFDIIVVYDISRFGRDGSDIIGECRFLKRSFDIDVIDTKGYDTRDHRNALMNFVKAGVSENERLTIMERTIGGRIEKAKNGLPWTGKPPVGRAFRETGKHSGEWYITEEGEKLAALLQRYADGEPLKNLASEYGFNCSASIIRNVHQSQLSGIYHAVFNAPEIGIQNHQIPIPAIPQIITPQLEARVKARLSHNQRCNKQGKRRYRLTGFVKCGQCGRALIAQKAGNRIYYRHYKNYAVSGQDCSYRGIRADVFEPAVLDYLYSFFLDEPAYTEAVKRAMPSKDDREMLAKDIRAVEKQLVDNNKGITNFAKAIKDGADIDLLRDEQTKLINEKRLLESRQDELTQTLAAMPSPEYIAKEAMLLRIALVEQHKNKDWHSLSYEEVRHFLHFLFGDNPMPRGQGQITGYGISVVLNNNKWHITFKGLVQFYHDIVNGRPVSHAFQKEAETLFASIKRGYKKCVEEAEKAYKLDCKESGQFVNVLKPVNDN